MDDVTRPVLDLPFEPTKETLMDFLRSKMRNAQLEDSKYINPQKMQAIEERIIQNDKYAMDKAAGKVFKPDSGLDDVVKDIDVSMFRKAPIAQEAVEVAPRFANLRGLLSKAAPIARGLTEVGSFMIPDNVAQPRFNENSVKPAVDMQGRETPGMYSQEGTSELLTEEDVKRLGLKRK